MIMKFTEEGLGSGILEIEKTDTGISFFVYESGEEQVGQYMTLPIKEIDNLIKFLQSFNQLQ